MRFLSSWIRFLGNAGAIDNARRACTDRSNLERAVDARLSVMVMSPAAAAKAA